MLSRDNCDTMFSRSKKNETPFHPLYQTRAPFFFIFLISRLIDSVYSELSYYRIIIHRTHFSQQWIIEQAWEPLSFGNRLHLANQQTSNFNHRSDEPARRKLVSNVDIKTTGIELSFTFPNFQHSSADVVIIVVKIHIEPSNGAH